MLPQMGVANVTMAPAPHFDRAAHFNQLSAEAVAELDMYFREKQMVLLQQLAVKAARLQDQSAGTLQFRAGGYFYSEDGT